MPYVSDLDQVSTPGVFYTYFYNYNHANRLRLSPLVFLEISTEILSNFWIHVAVLLLKPPRRGHWPKAAALF
jgi:hypothetical protein